QHPVELEETADVGAEEARAPVVEDEGDRALAAGQGVGVGGLPRAAGPEDDVERGWHSISLAAQRRWGSLLRRAPLTAMSPDALAFTVFRKCVRLAKTRMSTPPRQAAGTRWLKANPRTAASRDRLGGVRLTAHAKAAILE